MYQQAASSDQQIPVLVTSKFGTDPTGSAVAFAVTTTPYPAPAQNTVTLAATWYTDTTVTPNQHYAMCQCGPASPYVPTAGSTVYLWVKFTSGATLVLGPVAAQFT